MCAVFSELHHLDLGHHEAREIQGVHWNQTFPAFVQWSILSSRWVRCAIHYSAILYSVWWSDEVIHVWQCGSEVMTEDCPYLVQSFNMTTVPVGLAGILAWPCIMQHFNYYNPHVKTIHLFRKSPIPFAGWPCPPHLGDGFRCKASEIAYPQFIAREQECELFKASSMSSTNISHINLMTLTWRGEELYLYGNNFCAIKVSLFLKWRKKSLSVE